MAEFKGLVAQITVNESQLNFFLLGQKNQNVGGNPLPIPEFQEFSIRRGNGNYDAMVSLVLLASSKGSEVTATHSEGVISKISA